MSVRLASFLSLVVLGSFGAGLWLAPHVGPSAEAERGSASPRAASQTISRSERLRLAQLAVGSSDEQEPEQEQEPELSEADALAQLYQGLDERLETETEDPQWHPVREARDAIAEIGARAGEVDCVGSMCRASMAFSSLREKNAALEDLTDASPFAGAIVYRHDDTRPAEVVAYFIRPGVQLD